MVFMICADLIFWNADYYDFDDLRYFDFRTQIFMIFMICADLIFWNADYYDFDDLR